MCLFGWSFISSLWPSLDLLKAYRIKSKEASPNGVYRGALICCRLDIEFEIGCFENALPVGVFRRLAGAEAEAELLELGSVMWLGRVEVFRFGDELHGIVARQAGLFQDGFKRLEIVGGDDQPLMF